MENEPNISGVIKKISKSSDEVYAKVCEVLEVNMQETTVDVKPIDGTAEIFDVRLQAESETGGLVIFPKVGSMVLVVFLNKNNPPKSPFKKRGLSYSLLITNQSLRHFHRHIQQLLCKGFTLWVDA